MTSRRLCRLVLVTAHRSYSSGNSNILKLHDRGIFQTVFPEEKTADLLKAVTSSPQCVYCGYDPTADSLHVGNLLSLLALLHCQRGGHQPMALIGGATALIGDPSGRTKERLPLEGAEVSLNVEGISECIARIFANHQEYFVEKGRQLKPVKILNNADWYFKRNVVEFLSTVGRHFRMGKMLLRHSVQSRMQSKEGMNLTEFTYQVFQSYDWLHLYKQHNCSIQIGGNDQTGNLVAGYEFISRVTGKSVFGLTVPLITNTTGDKLGKSAGNAVWLSADKTSPFDLYQFYMRQPDSEMEKQLKMFTFLSDEEIADLVRRHKRKPELRKAQRILAENVTLLVHGRSGLQLAQRCTDALYSGSVESLAQLSQQEMLELFANAPTTQQYLDPGTTVMDVALSAKCFGNERDAKRLISAGGFYINHQRVKDTDAVLIPGQHILTNNITLLRVGKKNHYIVKWLS